jgi:prepilin-type N-terminal cleavage/methylation domain-containing protein
MQRGGFTFIELVVVIVVLGIISYVSFAAIGRVMNGIQATGAADKIASDIRYAQSMAGSNNLWYGVSFEATPTNIYSIYTTNGTTDTYAVNPANRGTNFIINLGADYNANITVAIPAGTKKIVFSPLGTPYTNYKTTGIPITAEAVITVNSSRTVRITPLTGRVYIQ